MKHLLTIILFLPLLSFSQDCKLRQEKDPYTKEAKLSSGFISLQGGSVTIDADNKEIDYFFTLTGADKCFTEASSVIIYFEGTKSKATFRNAGGMNCDGYFHFKFRNVASTHSTMKRLATLNVEQLIFTGNNKKETIITLLPEQQKMLKDFSACMVTESKTLIK
jgi:hypothetical protein